MPRHANSTSFKYNPDAHIQLVCESCNGNFTVRRSEIRKRKGRIRYCSMKCMGHGRIGSKNPAWAGDGVTYHQLHAWIRKRLPTPALCQMCKQRPPRDLVNLTGIYDRDLINWVYFCASCHSIYDGDVTNLPKPA